MKKLFLFAALLTAAGNLDAQEDYKNAVKINPLSLFLATGNVSYERAVSDKQTFQIGVFYTGVKVSDIKYSGIGVTPEYRFYVAGKKTALHGVYVAPFLRYQNFSLKDKETNDKASFSSFGGGAALGWQSISRSGFVINLFVGPQYNSGKVKVDEGSEDEFDVSAGFDGFGIRIGAALGFAF